MIHLRRTRLPRIDDICAETLLATVFLILLSRYIENNVREEDKRLFLFLRVSGFSIVDPDRRWNGSFFSFFHSIQQFRIIRRNFLFYPSFSLGERANAQRESIGRKSRCQQTLNLNPFLSAERGSNRYRRSREPRIVNSSTPSPFSISRPSIPKNFIRYYSELHELLSPFRSSPPPSFRFPRSGLLPFVRSLPLPHLFTLFAFVYANSSSP